MAITLLHGSHDAELSEIRDFCPTAAVDFGGLFFSSYERSALSHGQHVYCVEIDEAEIADERELALWADEIEALGLDASDDEIEAAIEDSGSSWDCQILRGRIAKALGFRAVTMNDEHGTSYLVFSGTKIVRR